MATNAPQKLPMRSDFRITYYSKKDEKFISRLGKWADKSRFYISKSGKKCLCYYQLSDGEAKEGYRTATGRWKIEFTKFGNCWARVVRGVVEKPNLVNIVILK